MDELLAKHKVESKELQAKIQGMKHAVPKGDKKKKKQVAMEIAILEGQLEEKHQAEIKDLNTKESAEPMSNDLCEALDDANLSQNQEPTKKLSKAQKRRERKEAEEKERQQRIAEAEISNVNSARNVEAIKLQSVVSEKGFQLKEIAADGNCLYNAVADQLSTSEMKYGWQTLRSMTAEYLRKEKDQFLPFLSNPDTGEPQTDAEFEKYCDDVEQTNTWGGHVEMQALSVVLGRPIEIFQADLPILKIGEELNGRSIRLSYHKHAYGLGEHYNSVIPKEE
eukprot:Seg1830.7 transcript_id=Seg1830.7/GoldUCD/mRNA.D3Y31 product="Deubiquitinase OTUD6B" protein_id=Seg1830.7/GoldUCD/D3Y31